MRRFDSFDIDLQRTPGARDSLVIDGLEASRPLWSRSQSHMNAPLFLYESSSQKPESGGLTHMSIRRYFIVFIVPTSVH